MSTLRVDNIKSRTGSTVTIPENNTLAVTGIVSVTSSGGITNAGTLTNTGTLNNTGNVNITGGITTVGGAATISGNVWIAGITTISGNLVNNGTFTNNGTFNFNDLNVTGGATVGGALTVTGNLTVNGTQTIINTTSLEISDKTLGIGSTSTPSNVLANGAGIVIYGDTNKTLLWNNSNSSLDFSENVNILSGKTYEINGTTVLSSTQVLGFAIASENTSSTIVSRDSSGNFSAGIITASSFVDSAGNLRSIPQNSRTSSYTLLASDNGKHISITTGGVTIPASVFSIGDSIAIFNNSGSSQTITQGGSVTLRQAGTANTGNRTLGQYGICTVLCVASNTFVISGSGLS